MNQFELNRKIEAFIKAKDSKGEHYSVEDIEFIQQYEGDGGQGSKGATGEGLLYEFYTPCYRDWETDRKSTRLTSSHSRASRMPSSA